MHITFKKKILPVAYLLLQSLKWNWRIRWSIWDFLIFVCVVNVLDSHGICILQTADQVMYCFSLCRRICIQQGFFWKLKFFLKVEHQMRISTQVSQLCIGFTVRSCYSVFKKMAWAVDRKQKNPFLVCFRGIFIS